MAEYKHGSMDISDHEKMFAGFAKFTTYATICIIIFLLLLALVNG